MDQDFILENVNRLKVEQIVSAIERGIVTFEELQNTGKFLRDKQDAVKARIDDIEEKRSAEKDAWETACNQNTVNAYKEYLEKFPDSNNSDEAEIRIKDLEEEEKNREENEIWDTVRQEDNILAYKKYLEKYPEGSHSAEAKKRIEEITKNNEQKKKDVFKLIKEGILGKVSIQERLDNGIITKEEVIKECDITAEELEGILKAPDFPDIFVDWPDLPAPKLNRTDIYFLGIPGSGKTTLLSGLLHYTRKNALINFERHNTIGYKYAQDLLKLTKISHLPPATSADAGINYIVAHFNDMNNNKFPVNIYEMSGEKITEAYNNDEIQSIGETFLENDNKKVIFFIIDYKHSENNIFLDQNEVLDRILILLEDKGILRKTSAIYSVLTKCDQLPGGAGDLDSAEEYLNNEYLSFRENIKDKSKKYGFKTKTLPFSIGKVKLNKIFEFDSKYSENLYKEVISSIQTNSRGKGLKWLFK